MGELLLALGGPNVRQADIQGLQVALGGLNVPLADIQPAKSARGSPPELARDLAVLLGQELWEEARQPATARDDFFKRLRPLLPQEAT